MQAYWFLSLQNQDIDPNQYAMLRVERGARSVDFEVQILQCRMRSVKNGA